jgi:nickel-dependent lactate racemase
MCNVINVPYGNESLKIDVSNINIKQVITPKDVTLPDDIEFEIQKALNNPIGSGKISDIVAYETKVSKKAESPDELDVVIISDDNTRLTPSNLILPPILKEMETAGISRDKIKIVMALGTHRDMSEKEMIDKVGKHVYNNYKIVNHNYYDENKLTDLGTTEYGTPIMINKDVYEADIVIGIGSIVPHHIPGFSGGAKIIQPGVSGSLTTAYTHLLSVRKRRSFLGYIENPVREEMEDIARKVGANYIFNTVLSREGDFYKCFFGDVAKAFRKGVKASQEVYEVEVDSTSPVTLAGSFPCNIEFWQAHH